MEAKTEQEDQNKDSAPVTQISYVNSKDKNAVPFKKI